LESKTQKVWWFLGAVGTAAVVGFGAASLFQTESDAKEQHDAIKADLSGQMDEQDEQIEAQGVQIQDIVVRNVRIEYGIQQVQDELRRARIDSRRARTREEREEQAAELEVLEERIQRRESALQRSYEQRPLIPGGGSQVGALEALAETAE